MLSFCFCSLFIIFSKNIFVDLFLWKSLEESVSSVVGIEWAGEYRGFGLICYVYMFTFF
jgi:hypothetical protein